MACAFEMGVRPVVSYACHLYVHSIVRVGGGVYVNNAAACLNNTALTTLRKPEASALVVPVADGSKMAQRTSSLPITSGMSTSYWYCGPPLDDMIIRDVKALSAPGSA